MKAHSKNQTKARSSHKLSSKFLVICSSCFPVRSVSVCTTCRVSFSGSVKGLAGCRGVARYSPKPLCEPGNLRNSSELPRTGLRGVGLWLEAVLFCIKQLKCSLNPVWCMGMYELLPFFLPLSILHPLFFPSTVFPLWLHFCAASYMSHSVLFPSPCTKPFLPLFLPVLRSPSDLTDSSLGEHHQSL